MLSKPDIDFNIENPSTVEFLERIQPQTGIYRHSFSYTSYVSLYLFALPYCRDKQVLDAACGLGYGSYILSAVAKQVTGIDLSEEAVKYAGEKFRLESVQFEMRNAVESGLPDASFDVIVSIETFEHIPPEYGEPFLDELKRLLKNDGLLILSTPNRPVFSALTKTADHVNELDVDELHELLKSRFGKIEHYYQRKRAAEKNRAFFSMVRADSRRWREYIPNWMRWAVKKIMASELTYGVAELLPKLRVQRADNLDDVRLSAIQIVVCQK